MSKMPCLNLSQDNLYKKIDTCPEIAEYNSIWVDDWDYLEDSGLEHFDDWLARCIQQFNH